MVEDIQWHQAKLKRCLDDLAMVEANYDPSIPNRMIDDLKRRINLLENLIAAHRKQNAPKS
jgi:hypothetical protein